MILTTAGPTRPAPRERLLAAADRLFYEEGVCTVGIDRILEEADVARASLYSTYGSKDELIRAYLQKRSEDWRALVAEALPTRWDNPRDRMLGIFELMAEWFNTPDYRGCPFINASAEAAVTDVVSEVCDFHREWLRDLFSRLGKEVGLEDPEGLSAQLVLLCDGAMVGAQLDKSIPPGQAALSAAGALIDAATRRRG
jgi:AcrR family transcriptional regulator